MAGKFRGSNIFFARNELSAFLLFGKYPVFFVVLSVLFLILPYFIFVLHAAVLFPLPMGDAFIFSGSTLSVKVPYHFYKGYSTVQRTLYLNHARTINRNNEPYQIHPQNTSQSFGHVSCASSLASASLKRLVWRHIFSTSKSNALSAFMHILIYGRKEPDIISLNSKASVASPCSTVGSFSPWARVCACFNSRDAEPVIYNKASEDVTPQLVGVKEMTLPLFASSFFCSFEWRESRSRAVWKTRLLARAADIAHSNKEPTSIHLLKKLRTHTGCSITKCKEALTACCGDLQAALEWLRCKGIASAAVGPTVELQRGQGVVAVAAWTAEEEHPGKLERRTTEMPQQPQEIGKVILKLSCTSDFVARNEKVTRFIRRVAILVADSFKRKGFPRDMPAKVEAAASSSTVAMASLDNLVDEKVCERRHMRVCAGVPLIEHVLALPWSHVEEFISQDPGSEDVVGVDVARINSASFFQEHHVRKTKDVHTQDESMSHCKHNNKTRQKEQEHLQRPCVQNSKSLTTVEDELHLLSSIVGEPLRLTDAGAMCVLSDWGIIASYVHGIISTDVGTLAVLVALEASEVLNVRGPVFGIKHGRCVLPCMSENEKKFHPQLLTISQQNDSNSTTRMQSAQTVLNEGPHVHSIRKVSFFEENSGSIMHDSNKRTECSERQDLDNMKPVKSIDEPHRFKESLLSLAEEICMQVAAGKALALDESSLDEKARGRELNILRAQAEACGKGPSTVERMVAGRYNKWLKEALLCRQTWLLNDSCKSVQQVLSDFAKRLKLKKPPKIQGFVRMQIP